MALLVICCIGCGRDISAAEWTLKGSLGQQLQYNDNIAMSPVSKESVVGYLLAPGFQATRKSGAWILAFKGRVIFVVTMIRVGTVIIIIWASTTIIESDAVFLV